MSLKNLRDWFDQNRRSFPWRDAPSPYRVWISEVMLQQTRASVVVPYFLRWMEQFPTIESLARAPLEDVIKAWEGLGYYSRARNLHEGACYLVAHHGGELPCDVKALQEVKGLGPYTIGAILSFAFHRKAAAIDGNVMRVITRLFCIEEVVSTRFAQKAIEAKVLELLPEIEPWVVMEALIELGATICTPRPNCSTCPFQDDCLGYQTGKAERLPVKKPPATLTRLERVVPLIYHDGAYLVQKHSLGKVMAGLYEFPYFPKGDMWQPFYPGPLRLQGELECVKHTFTRFEVTLYPSLWHAEKREEIEGFCWKEAPVLKALPFSAGHKKVLVMLEELNAHFTH